jgi:hypothetical protein
MHAQASETMTVQRANAEEIYSMDIIPLDEGSSQARVLEQQK